MLHCSRREGACDHLACPRLGRLPSDRHHADAAAHGRRKEPEDGFAPRPASAAVASLWLGPTSTLRSARIPIRNRAFGPAPLTFTLGAAVVAAVKVASLALAPRQADTCATRPDERQCRWLTWGTTAAFPRLAPPPAGASHARGAPPAVNTRSHPAPGAQNRVICVRSRQRPTCRQGTHSRRSGRPGCGRCGGGAARQMRSRVLSVECLRSWDALAFADR
jgi:hypothetical protein